MVHLKSHNQIKKNNQTNNKPTQKTEIKKKKQKKFHLLKIKKVLFICLRYTH